MGDEAIARVARANLIERRRDQSESEAVSFVHARQQSMPTCPSLPPLLSAQPPADTTEDPSIGHSQRRTSAQQPGHGRV
jgi:hypothetical protein